MKAKFPRAAALAVAKELCDALRPLPARLIVAGSLRRRKDEVGDVEILFVPLFVNTHPHDLFAPPRLASRVDHRLLLMLDVGTLKKRPNKAGGFAWGEKNKLAVHAATGIPVDLFTATEENWFNYLVCRTGPAESNVRIASAALAKGWEWNPYDSGFSRAGGLGVETHTVASEREVFEFVGLPFKEPWER